MRLVSQEDFDKAKSRDMIYLYCDGCNTTFPTLKHETMSKVKKGIKKRYCSANCARRSLGKPINGCLACGKDTKTKFCSQSCAATFNRTGRYKYPRYSCLECGKLTPNEKFCCQKCHRDFQTKEYIRRWKDGLELGYSGSKCTVSKVIRVYLLKKYDNKCARCGWCEINP